ncbi:MAG TPA: hypothetical protein VJ044_11350 [Candidatus Hodarchaeales archaeon]|nr:hypothetical protein [Candidatus Hodarchaeales archaeon]
MITLDELVERLPNARRYQDYVLASCLWHDDAHPSMLVYLDGFRCLSCSKRGKITELLKQIDYTDFHPKIQEKKFRDFKNPFNRWLEENSISEFCFEAHRNIKRWPDQAHYLKKRKIDHLIDKLKLGFKDGWYVFPIRDRYDEIITAVARAGEAIQEAKDVRYMMPHDTEPILYVPDWKLLDSASEIFVPYGIIDAITLYSLGLASATGVMGQNLSPLLFKDIRKPINIVPDLGESAAAYKLAGSLGWRGSVRCMRYPEDSKDVSDIFRYHGPSQLSALLA